MRTPPRPGTFRTPPGPGRAEPVRAAPVAPAAPTTVAAAAPTTREQPFRIVVRGVDKRALREMWQRLCHDYPNTPQDFNEIYEHTPRFSDDAFSFKRGNPDQFRETIENLLYMHGIEGAVVTAER